MTLKSVASSCGPAVSRKPAVKASKFGKPGSQGMGFGGLRILGLGFHVAKLVEILF